MSGAFFSAQNTFPLPATLVAYCRSTQPWNINMPALKCPICKSRAEDHGEKDYGDKHRYNCPRCGPYEISGTAQSMLASRLMTSDTAPGRLSHALRTLPKKDGEWFMVTSANIDELMNTPLPDVDHQTRNLLVWLAAQIGDNHLGGVRIQRPEYLAGVLGTLDEKHVRRLIQFAKKADLVANASGSELCITPKGWKTLEQNQARPAPESSLNEMTDKPVKTETDSPEAHVENQIVKANCNKCGGIRNAFVRRSYKKSEHDEAVSWSDKIETLECCGCGDLSIRHELWFSEWDEFDNDPLTGDPVMIPGVKTTVWPAVNRRTKPNWSARLEDDALRDVLDEVYTALAEGMLILAGIGTRTLLDSAMFLKGDDPKGGFAGKLKAMVDGGKMGAHEKETILAMVDGGNAAAHKGYTPSSKTLDKVLSAAESLIKRQFIMPADAETVRKATQAQRAEANASTTSDKDG